MRLLPLMLIPALVFAAPTAFEDKASGFRVSFPKKPERTASTLGGTKETSFSVTTPAGRYLVAVVTDPAVGPAGAKDILDGFRQACAFEAVVEHEKPLTMGSATGLEMRTTGRNLEGEVRHRVQRLVVGKGRTWTVMVDVGAKQTLEAAGAEAFLASFSLLAP